jgi:hypothetical protein
VVLKRLEGGETYAGYARTERFASPERLAQDSRKTYSAPARPSLNQWGLSGSWIAGAESAALQGAQAVPTLLPAKTCETTPTWWMAKVSV